MLDINCLHSKMKHYKIQLPAATPPTVELDSDARAAYIRFSSDDVARTEVVASAPVTITVDFSRNNSVVGVELVGVDDFSIESLVKEANLHMPLKSRQGANYVPVASTARPVLQSGWGEIPSRRKPKRRPAEEGVKSGQKTLADILRKAES